MPSSLWEICPGAPDYRSASGAEEVDRKSPPGLGDTVWLHAPGPSSVIVEIRALPGASGNYHGEVLNISGHHPYRAGVGRGQVVEFKWRHVFMVTRAKA